MVLSQAYARIRDWCNFLGMPCGNCPFSIPPYNDDEGCFVDGVEVCSLDDIILDGDKFKGWAGRCPLWRKRKSVVSYGKQAVSYEAESPAFRRGEYVKKIRSDV